MKAFILKNDYFQITEERGAFLYGKNNAGKVACVEAQKAQVVEIESLPKPAYRRAKKAAAVKVDPVQTWKNIALCINNRWNDHTGYQLAIDSFGRVNAKGNEFIESLLRQMFADNRLTEAQAYHLAKFSVETGQLN